MGGFDGEGLMVFPTLQGRANNTSAIRRAMPPARGTERITK